MSWLLKSDRNAIYINSKYLPQLATENEIEAIKYGLVNVRQFQVYVDALKQELKNVMNRLSNLDQELLQRITDIQRKVSINISIEFILQTNFIDYSYLN